MNATNQFAALVGRVALALLFVTSGFGKIGKFDGTAGYIASKGLPLPEVGAAIAIVVELIGGLMIVVGWKTRWTALAIAVFLIPTTLIFHAYWNLPADKQMVDSIMFWKNLSIFGGMLLLWAFGPGRYSVDKG